MYHSVRGFPYVEGFENRTLPKGSDWIALALHPEDQGTVYLPRVHLQKRSTTGSDILIGALTLSFAAVHIFSVLKFILPFI